MKNTTIIAIVIIVAVAGIAYTSTQNKETPLKGYMQLEPCTGSLTILYDNYIYDTRGQAEWGFSCLIEIEDTTIFFDTGGEPDVLRHNIEAFNVDVSEIDCIVLSHEHWDHVGGMEVILSARPDLPVYLPEGTPYHVKSALRSLGGECIELENSTMICDNIATTMTLDGPPREQALMIRTQDGMILVTGCSHPGVHNLARNAYETVGKDIQLVIGGFHLGGASEATLEGICDELDEIGVEKISATHCTGDEARAYFRERYGEGFVKSGVGFHLEF